jgi:hypothetical protein
LKPGYHLIGSMGETRRFQAMGELVQPSPRMVNMFITTVTSSSGTRCATHTAELVAG